MLHPAITLRKSKLEGLGIFAKSDIPKGTLVWVDAGNVRTYKTGQIRTFSKRYQNILEKFGWSPKPGTIKYALGREKYCNHNCNPNIHRVNLDEEYNAEISIRDIKKGEEITLDYGPIYLGNFSITCKCESKNCRKRIRKVSLNHPISKALLRKSQNAKKLISKVKQPLLSK